MFRSIFRRTNKHKPSKHAQESEETMQLVVIPSNTKDLNCPPFGSPLVRVPGYKDLGEFYPRDS